MSKSAVFLHPAFHFFFLYHQFAPALVSASLYLASKCPGCGDTLVPNCRFCTNCGMKFPSSVPPAKTGPILTPGATSRASIVSPPKAVPAPARFEDEDDGDGLPPCVIIDNGQGTFRGGFSNQDKHSVSMPGFAGCAGDGSETLAGTSLVENWNPGFERFNDSVFQDVPTNWDDLEEMWDTMLQHLQVEETSDMPILMTIPLFAPKALKQHMREVLFESFNFAAVYIAPAPLLTAYAYGNTTTLVVDVGESSAQCMALVDGFSISHAKRRAGHLSGASMTKHLMSVIADEAGDNTLTGGICNPLQATMVARAIKEQLCEAPLSVSDYYRRVEDPDFTQIFNYKPPGSSEEISLCFTSHVAEVSELCFSPAEVLNDYDGSIVSLPALAAQVVEACPIDHRRELCKNIILGGKVSTMKGFAERFESELKSILPPGERLSSTFRVCANPDRGDAAWLGGQILASTMQGQTAFQSRWEYDEGVIPEEDYV
jgi:actin-related protein